MPTAQVITVISSQIQAIGVIRQTIVGVTVAVIQLAFPTLIMTRSGLIHRTILALRVGQFQVVGVFGILTKVSAMIPRFHHQTTMVLTIPGLGVPQQTTP